MMKTIRNEYGITLIALIVTIILIFILATVSLSLIFGNGDLLDKANDSTKIYDLSEEQERLELVKIPVQLDNDGTVTVDTYLEEAIKEGITKPEDIFDNDDDSKNFITDTGYDVNVKPDPDHEGNVIITINGKPDKLPVHIMKMYLVPSTNNITVELTVRRDKGAIYKFYYKEENGEYIYSGESTNTTYTISGLKQDTIYRVKVEAINNNGIAEKEAMARTKIVSPAQGVIDFEDFKWNNGTASVKVVKNSEDNLQMQYQIVNSTGTTEWSIIESGAIITGLKAEDQVVVRLWDGYNGGNTTVFYVIDNISPSAIIEPSSTNTFIQAVVTATVTHTDNESSIDLEKCRYVYNTLADKIGTDENLYSGTFTKNPEPLELVANTIETYYLHVLTVDVYGNKQETISVPIIVKDNKVISNLNPGDYIYYDPGSRTYTSPSSANGMSNQTYNSSTYKGTWRVLTNNGTAVTIIPSIATSNLQIKGQAGYNNFINELNKISNIYIHPTYAISARIVGYSDYNTDITNLKKINALSITNTYWLGSRFSQKDSNGRTFYNARTIVSGGNQYNSWVYYTSSSGKVYVDTPSFGIRPIITLKPDAPLSKGTGTSGDYYILK